MAVELVLTAIAQDRPGVVEALADVVAAHSGNWVDSSMARLGGEFAGILRITVDDDQVKALRAALAGLGEQDIDITVRRDTAPEAPSGPHARLALTGLDHPGIILEISRVLARHQVSIDELHTSVFPGSMSSEPMFSAHADVVLPEELQLAELREALERIANDIMVDIDLTKAPEA